MTMLHRIIHKIDPDKWGEVVQWEEKYEAVERRYGAPSKRLYRAGFGPYDTDTLIVEAEWESAGALEEIYAEAMADPEWQKIRAEAASVFLTRRHESYVVLK